MGFGKQGVCRLLEDLAPSRERHRAFVSGLTCHLTDWDSDDSLKAVDGIGELDEDSRSWAVQNMGPLDANETQHEQDAPYSFSLPDLAAAISGAGSGGSAGKPDKHELVEVCPLPVKDVDFATKVDLSAVEQVESAAACQHACTEVPRCETWSWGENSDVPVIGITQMCWLKALEEGARPERNLKAGIVSGFRCRNETRSKASKRDDLVIVGEGNWEEQLNGIAESMRPFPPGSLYCFALMQPQGYERGLIEMQYHMKTSIFDCDEPAVYSNEVIHIVPGFQTHVVDSDLKCLFGGEFNTALNTPIFIAVWDKVVEVGRFRMHEWTVKVDPDCVFVPSRLRGKLEYHKPDFLGQALYLNNCKSGMHGPLEVLSQTAVQVWHDNTQRCADAFGELCAGDCLWGEDMFLDQCFIRVLQEVRRDDDFELLVEDHCFPPPDWESCLDQSKVAYHPFKTEDGYRSCMAGAGLVQLLQF